MRFPRASSYGWLFLIPVAVTGFAVWALLTRSSTDGVIGVVVAVLAWAFALRVRLVGDSELVGTTVVYRGLFGTRRVDLAGAAEVRLWANPAGIANLRVRPAGGRPTTDLPVLLMTAYVKKCMEPDGLDRLGAAAAGAADPRGDGVATVLRMQAEHLRGGGALADSPMRPLTDARMFRGAEGARLRSILDR